MGKRRNPNHNHIQRREDFKVILGMFPLWARVEHVLNYLRSTGSVSTPAGIVAGVDYPIRHVELVEHLRLSTGSTSRALVLIGQACDLGYIVGAKGHHAPRVWSLTDAGFQLLEQHRAGQALPWHCPCCGQPMPRQDDAGGSAELQGPPG